jgi:hypothetical protein
MKINRNKSYLLFYLYSNFLFTAIFLTSCGPYRDGNQLYLAFLGEPIENCLQILEFKDRPTIDGASAYLYFNMCPAELNRILTQRDYTKTVYSKKNAISIETATYGGIIPKWWTPSKLGDSCIQYQYLDDDEDWAETLFVSFDSTKAYYRDDRY